MIWFKGNKQKGNKFVISALWGVFTKKFEFNRTYAKQETFQRWGTGFVSPIFITKRWPEN